MSVQRPKCFQQELYEIINHSSFQGTFQNGFYLSTFKVISHVIYSQADSARTAYTEGGGPRGWAHTGLRRGRRFGHACTGT